MKRRINNNKIKEDKRKTTDETKNKSAEQKQKDAAVAWTWKGWFLFILGKVEVVLENVMIKL